MKRWLSAMLVIPMALIASTAFAQGSGKNAKPGPQLHRISARASEIDKQAKAHPEIDFLLEKDGKPQDVQNGVVDTRVPSQGRLVIWLMGYSQGIAERTAGYGLHYIDVHYPRQWFGKLNQKAGEDDQFLGNIRLEATTGQDASQAVSIPRADSLAGRSIQFVKYLAKKHPEGKWDQFLTKDGNDLQWEKVTLAGSSHGATSSARLAKHQRVGRVVMFCGPRDQLEVWQGITSATPSNRYFGFSHVLDTGWSGDHYCRSWQLMGLNEFGPIVDVDKVPSPYKNSRRLITEADVGGNAGRAHGCVVPGRSAVVDSDGKFIHEDVWRYLFMHPVDEVGEKTGPDADCRMDLRTPAK